MEIFHKLLFCVIKLYQMKKIQKFSIFNLIALSFLTIVLIAVSTLPLLKSNDDDISLNYLEEQATMQGIIELWNVDTFSGGSISKSDYLNKVARLFESSNKGLYINIKNMSVEEFSLALSAGRIPSLLSFGYGVGDLVKDILTPLALNLNSVKPEVKNSSTLDGNQYAIGFLMGGYAFYSTSEKLSNASKENTIKMSKEFATCGFDKSLKKSTKHIYGLIYGDNNFISPNNCILTECVNEFYKSVEDYNAYVDFISLNKATILLGTQRDLVKLKGKVERGAIQDLLVEPVSTYNDLVQYVGLVNGQNEQVDKYSKLFIEYLLSESSQKLLAGSGLFSTTMKGLYADNEFGSLESAVWECINIPNVF